MRSWFHLSSTVLFFLTLWRLNEGKNVSVSNIFHVLIVDAGSSGTRAHYYTIQQNNASSLGLKVLSEQSAKTKPGLSAYEDNIKGGIESVMKVIDQVLPPHFNPDVISFDLEATAGMRLLHIRCKAISERMMQEMSEALRRRYSHFHICPKCVILSEGRDEGLYSFITVNYLAGTFPQTQVPARPLHGIVEVGGASLQIVLQIQEGTTGLEQGVCPFDVPEKFKFILNNKCVSSVSYFYYGLDLSRYIFSHLPESCITHDCPQYQTVSSPCLHANFTGQLESGATKVAIKGAAYTNSENRYTHCYSSLKNALKDKGVLQRQGHLSNVEEPVYLISSIPLTFQVSGYLTNKTQFTLGEINHLARRSCKDVTFEGEYKPYYCMNMVYFVILLQDGFGFSSNQKFEVKLDIDGKEIEWTLGAALVSTLEHIHEQA